VDVFLVEPDPRIAAFVRRVLREYGHVTRIAGTGAAALEALTSGPICDQIIVDAELPDMSGFELCRWLRAADVWTTALVLVERGADAVPVHASGADGFLRRPFSGAALLSALDDTSATGLSGEVEVDFGLTIDRGRRVVVHGGTEIRLSPTELALFELLVRRRGEVVAREDLLVHAWRYDYENASNAVDVYLRRLREKIDRPFGTAWIETVRGRGYRFSGPRSLSSSPHRQRGG
jgi:two-component system OmpR family response regulator